MKEELLIQDLVSGLDSLVTSGESLRVLGVVISYNQYVLIASFRAFQSQVIDADEVPWKSGYDRYTKYSQRIFSVLLGQDQPEDFGLSLHSGMVQDSTFHLKVVSSPREFPHFH